jgi:hypothetical protein
MATELRRKKQNTKQGKVMDWVMLEYVTLGGPAFFFLVAKNNFPFGLKDFSHLRH